MIYETIRPVNLTQSLIDLRCYKRHPLAGSSLRIDREFSRVWHTHCNFVVAIKSIPGYDFQIFDSWTTRFGVTTTAQMHSLTICLDLKQIFRGNYECAFFLDVGVNLSNKETGNDTTDTITIDFGPNRCIHKSDPFHTDLMAYANANLAGLKAFPVSVAVGLAKFMWAWVFRGPRGMPDRGIQVCLLKECAATRVDRIQAYVFRADGRKRQ